MAKFKKKYIDPTLLRPTVIDVDLEALKHNYQILSSLFSPAQLIPVVKANAYGHGIVTCSKYLEMWGACAFAVGLVEEGIELREAGIRAPILVLGGLSGGQIKLYLDYALDITASSLFKLDAINEEAEKSGKIARVHLKVDTGMERIGVHHYSFRETIKNLKKYKRCQVVGIYSHFAAPGLYPEFTTEQLKRFLDCVSILEDCYQRKIMRHIAASAGGILYPESRLDAVRAGIALYGIYPNGVATKAVDLRPVMKLSSKVVYFKVVKKGAAVSYDLTWTAPEDTRIVTVPIGYGDGYFRGLTNKGSALIRGRRYPIVGRICMDQLMINIGQDEAYNGDEVVLIGQQSGEKITVSEIANLLETNTYEVLVCTHKRVPRRYHIENEEFIA
ncbi:MAG: alanine racemase [Deltaproteobacteria bacterium]|nr:alanine racemase [Deltaproteobacteria bacterium]